MKWERGWSDVRSSMKEHPEGFNSYGVTGLSYRKVGGKRGCVHVQGGVVRFDRSPLMKDVRQHEVVRFVVWKS